MEKRKEEFIVDNGINGIVDLPGFGISIKKGEYDIDLCELTGKSVKELLSDPQIRYAIKRGWLIPKEKKNGKRIVFKRWDKIDISKIQKEIDAYLEGKKIAIPSGMIKDNMPELQKEVVDAKEVSEDNEKVLTEEEIDNMEYGDLLKMASQYNLEIENNKKITIIRALKKYFGYIKEDKKDKKDKEDKEDKKDKKDKE